MLFGAAWLLTTLIFDHLLRRIFRLPAGAGYPGEQQDVLTVYLLPLITCVWPLVASALFGIERLWRTRLVGRARVCYGALSVALIFWCRWSLQTILSHGYGFHANPFGLPADSVQAVAYASALFPFATACACALLACLRRAAPARIT